MDLTQVSLGSDFNMTTAVLLEMMLGFEPKESGIMTRPSRDPPIADPDRGTARACRSDANHHTHQRTRVIRMGKREADY
jgi:hypothetical protein